MTERKESMPDKPNQAVLLARPVATAPDAPTP